MYIEDRLDAIEMELREIKNILLHRVVPIDLPKEVKNEEIKEEPKPKAEEKQPKKSKKDDADKPKPVAQVEPRTTPPDGIKTVIGLIDNTIQGPNGEIICLILSKEPVINPNTGLADIKYSFLIRKDGEDKRYGTWDTALAKKVMECIDNRRLVKFEYKERLGGKDGKKIFNDIVSFSEATVE